MSPRAVPPIPQHTFPQSQSSHPRSGAPLPAVSHNRTATIPAPPPLEGVVRLGMSEFEPGNYWVVINFPGRSALTLCTNASREQANLLFAAAESIGREAMAFAAAKVKGGGQPELLNVARLVIGYFGDGEFDDELLDGDIELRNAARDAIAKVKGGGR